MIKSFTDKRTKELFETGNSRRWDSIALIAVRKLVQLHSAVTLDDLNAPQGNRLEALRGDRASQHPPMLVIIGDLQIEHTVNCPPEAYPPLIINANASPWESPSTA